MSDFNIRYSQRTIISYDILNLPRFHLYRSSLCGCYIMSYLLLLERRRPFITYRIFLSELPLDQIMSYVLSPILIICPENIQCSYQSKSWGVYMHDELSIFKWRSEFQTSLIIPICGPYKSFSWKHVLNTICFLKINNYDTNDIHYIPTMMFILLSQLERSFVLSCLCLPLGRSATLPPEHCQV